MQHLSLEEFMSEQNKILEQVKGEPSHRNYWNAYNRLKKMKPSKLDVPDNQKVNIALLSTFTIDPLAMYLDIDSRMLNLLPSIYIGPFNQIQQEIINKESLLYQRQPHIVFIFMHWEHLVESNFRIKFPRMSTEEKTKNIDQIISMIQQLMDNLTSQTSAVVVLSNFVVPNFSPFGILDNKQELGYRRFVRLLNDKMEDLAKQNSQVFIMDLNEVASYHGKEAFINYQNYYRGSLLFSESFLPYVSKEAMSYIKALKGKNRKVIVLDLDNTLWGGIIGEDGMENIKLNVNYPGNDFYDFQKSILSLYNRGIILAINSKNNEEDALEVFRDHPYMLIKESNIASFRINWQDKVQNLIEIAKDINVGIDSLVFFDDNPVERARVRESLPDVLVVEMPKSPALYRKTLEELNDFNVLSLTEEDLKRGEMYYSRRMRKQVESQVKSIDDFIKSLELVVEIKRSNPLSLPRITSLLNRTNQFNLTTRRYTHAQVEDMHKDSDKFRIYSLRVRDKFGDEGIVGVAIIKIKSKDEWEIDSFLMSCRVIGRKIETTFLTKLIKDAQKEGVKLLTGEYIKTKKNKLVKDFYANHGFNPAPDNTEEHSVWHLNLENLSIDYPDFITISDE